MPKFLFPTTTSRHDARLSSTTHCALRASRINYNLTNLSRCNSFLHYFSSMDLCSSLPSSPFLFQFFPMLSSDSPGTLSLSAKITKLPSDSPGSLCQSHHNNLSLSLATLQALSLSLAKVTKPLTQQNCRSHMQRNCSILSHAAQSLSPIFPRLPLLPGTLSPISAKSIIQQWVTGISTLQCPVVSA